MIEQRDREAGHAGLWRAKWRWVVAYWVVQAVAVHVVMTVLFNGEPVPSVRHADLLWSPFWLMLNGIYAGVITAAQAVLLIPMRRPGVGLHGPGLRLVHSALGGLAVAGLVWMAMWPLATVLEQAGARWIFELPSRPPTSWAIPLVVWVSVTALLWGAGKDGLPVGLSVVIAAAAAAGLFAGLVGGVGSFVGFVLDKKVWAEEWTMASMSGAVLLGWVVATPLVWSFVKRRGAEDALARFSSRLFLGTVVEAAAMIPLDVMVRRKTGCYCQEGTYWTLAGCWAIGLFALGPVVFLVPLSKRRKRWFAGRCEACGYDMTGCMTAERCPECGAGWRPAGDERAGGARSDGAK
ncbi:MAG: hypothetical protein KF678_12860 [Phycisphaeraceae bacterium]|nr:hypothetical protein [Phycisphaeraceae bacterium]